MQICFIKNLPIPPFISRVRGGGKSPRNAFVTFVLDDNYADEEIKRLNTLSKTEILTKLKNESSEETYNNLSMVDTYILHVVSNDFLQKKLFKRDKGLVAELDRNETIRQKSLFHATNSYCHKK